MTQRSRCGKSFRKGGGNPGRQNQQMAPPRDLGGGCAIDVDLTDFGCGKQQKVRKKGRKHRRRRKRGHTTPADVLDIGAAALGKGKQSPRGGSEEILQGKGYPVTTGVKNKKRKRQGGGEDLAEDKAPFVWTTGQDGNE